jgi:hypothetical protein
MQNVVIFLQNLYKKCTLLYIIWIDENETYHLCTLESTSSQKIVITMFFQTSPQYT